jgi:uncharacterized protein YkwD
MKKDKFMLPIIAMLFAFLLSACGGGGGGSSSSGGGTSTGTTTPPAGQATEITMVSPNANALSSLSEGGDFATDSINYLNAFRTAAGLNVLTTLPALTTTAQNHANYEAAVSLVTHDETQSLSPSTFTGASVDQRIQAAHPTSLDGEITGSAFVVDTQKANGGSVLSITGLRDAPFHRENMFYCYQNVGAGSANGAQVFNAFYNSNVYTEYLNVDFADPCSARPADTQVVVWPFNGQTGVPTSWADTEAEQPAGGAVTNEHGSVLGYAVTMQGYNNASFSGMSFTITDSSGFVVPCAEYDSSNNSNAQAAMAAQCVPLLQLKPNTLYTVKVTGTMTNASFTASPVNLTWTFTTGAQNIVNTEFIAPNLNTTPSQPVNGLNATNTAILQAQYACQQYELANPSATAPCSWLANATVAMGNTNGAQTATAN